MAYRVINKYPDSLPKRLTRRPARVPWELAWRGSQYAPGAMSHRDRAPGINDILDVHPARVTLVGMLEQRHVIRLLLREGFASTQIPDRLSKAHKAHTLKTTQVFYWVRDI
jgi:hypothetical protein